MDLPFLAGTIVASDRPTRRRVPGAFQAAMDEVTRRTASSFGTAIIGLHEGGGSRIMCICRSGTPAGREAGRSSHPTIQLTCFMVQMANHFQTPQNAG